LPLLKFQPSYLARIF